jgi:hypothetical protein
MKNDKNLTTKYVRAFALKEPSGFADERAAIGAFADGRIGLMAADFDLIERAIVLVLAVIGAFVDGAADAFIGASVH